MKNKKVFFFRLDNLNHLDTQAVTSIKSIP